MAWGRASEANFYGKPNLGIASVLLFGGVEEGKFYVASPFVQGGGRGKTYENHTKSLQIIEKRAQAPVGHKIPHGPGPGGHKIVVSSGPVPPGS